MNIENRALNLINQLQQAMVQRDTQKILSMLEPDIMWVGYMEQQVCSGYDQTKEMLLRMAEDPVFSVIQNSWHKAIPISEDCCLVYGLLEMKPPFLDDSITQFRISAGCRLREGQMKLYQFHLATWDKDNGEEELLPKVLADEAINELKELVEKQSAELERKNRVLSALTDNIPGGVQKCRYDEYHTISYLSDGFCQLFGYTRDEIEKQFHNHYIEMIFPPDRAAVLLDVRESLARGNMIETQYRVVHKNGSLMWVLDRGKLEAGEDGEQYFYCMLMDITDFKRDQEELRLNLERHRVIMNQTNDIIFEWDMREDRMDYSPNWEKKFGYPPVCRDISKKQAADFRVHRDDYSTFNSIFGQPCKEVPYIEAELRIQTAAGNYIWCRIRASLQYDEEGKPNKLVGVIIDIDDEKKRSQKLVERAQKDGLTNLYNKGTSQALIEEYLSSCPSDEISALIVMDIDNFKQINDQMGHFCGDNILVQIASASYKLFRSSDIVGRIGGDEFIVLIKNIPAYEFAVRKAQKISKAIENIALEHKGSCSISCSLGIAFFPVHGRGFEELFQKADYALYQAKNRGKNRFECYENIHSDGVLFFEYDKFPVPMLQGE